MSPAHNKNLASTTYSRQRFAHPFFLPTPHAARQPFKGHTHMTSWSKTQLGPIPPVTKASTLTLDDVIGADGTKEIVQTGELRFHALGDSGVGQAQEAESVSDEMATDYNPSKRGITWLRELPLAEEEAQARDSDLRLLEQTEVEIAELEQRLVREAWQDEKVRLVMSIPGIDYTVAQTCLAAIGDVARFPNAKKLAAYLRLNPSTRQSGPHCYHGPITKQGNAHARWLLVQAAQHLGQYRGPLGQTMRRIIQRKNRSVAVVACARKLAVLLWHVLTSGEPFRYALPKSLEAKYSRLRVRATGRRRRGGVAKGTPRPAQMDTEGHGECLRFPRCWRKMTCRRSLRWPGEKKSCWREKNWTPSTANCKPLRASRPTHELRKSKIPKKMLNPS
jgi:transposase IS116/IS110/IS902 family protein